mmetsp:Transcript_8476/g.4612  ORF Transcript_8476/g.4612 Transcript_8476/m.4612 type:complete len:197 (-) Transcript_8476:4916-5506(-)
MGLLKITLLIFANLSITMRPKNKKGYKSLKYRKKTDTLCEKQKLLVKKVTSLASPLCESEGMELVHVEYQRESVGRVLRLYIDKSGGITLDDCTSISLQLSDILDVAIEIKEAYSLQVSSSGPNRPISKESDFQRFAGNLAVIHTNESATDKRKIKGILSGLSEGKVSINVNGQIVFIPIETISKAILDNYKGDFS